MAEDTVPGRTKLITIAELELMKERRDRMRLALKAISEAKVDDDTNHRELLALLMATASIAVKEAAS